MHIYYKNSQFLFLVFQAYFLEETWNHENISILDAYQSVFLIALRSYREYKNYSDFIKELRDKLKKKQPSYNLFSLQEEVIFTVLIEYVLIRNIA